MPRLPQRRRSFWVVLVAATGFLTIEPALCLVVAAVVLSAVAVVWTLLLVRALGREALGAGSRDDRRDCPVRQWREDVAVSSPAPPTSSGRGAAS